MAANPKIQQISGIPETGTLEMEIPLMINIINTGDEGDVYLNCWCASNNDQPYYPAARGIRLKTWRPAGASQLLTYSGLRGLSDAYDPTGYGLCFGCNPDQECWLLPEDLKKLTLLIETGYLTPDPAGGWDLLRKTDQEIITINMGAEGGGGLPLSTIAIIGGVALLGYVGYQFSKRR